MKKFNVGEAVYYPRATNKVLRLKDTNKSLTTRDLQVELGNISGGIPATFYKNGVHLNHGKAQEIFHATQENYELLSKLYPNVSFEPPPKRKEPREIIKAMLKSGWECVPCIFTNENGTKQIVIARRFDETNKAIPFDPKTGKTIIDFVDGEVVLEGGNE